MQRFSKFAIVAFALSNAMAQEEDAPPPPPPPSDEAAEAAAAEARRVEEEAAAAAAQAAEATAAEERRLAEEAASSEAAAAEAKRQEEEAAAAAKAEAESRRLAEEAAAAAAAKEAAKTPEERKKEREEAERRLGESEKRALQQQRDDALAYSAWYGHVDEIKQHIANGASVKGRWTHHEYHNFSPLLAIFNQMRTNWKEVAELLVKEGADANETVDDRIDIMHFAAQWNNTEAWAWGKSKMKDPLAHVCGGTHNVCDPERWQVSMCREAYQAKKCKEDVLSEAKHHPDYSAFAALTGLPALPVGKTEL